MIRPHPLAEHGRVPPGYHARRTRRPFGDVIPRPPTNPPLGEQDGDELLAAAPPARGRPTTEEITAA